MPGFPLLLCDLSIKLLFVVVVVVVVVLQTRKNEKKEIVSRSHKRVQTEGRGNERSAEKPKSIESSQSSSN